MNNYLKYGLLVAGLVVLGTKSVYFEKLSTRKAGKTIAFDAAGFSQKLWQEKMPAKMDSAVVFSTFMEAVDRDREAAINKYTNALAVGNYRYALVKLEGTVTGLNEDEVQLSVKYNDSLLTLNLATEFVYGNAIRDASGLVRVIDFPNTADLNSISEELNRIIRTSVLPSFKTAVKTGSLVKLVAAVEINKEHIHWPGIELIPVRLQIIP